MGFFPLTGLLTAASRSTPFVSSWSERPPSDNTAIVSSGAGSAIAFSELRKELRLTTLTLLETVEHVDGRLVAPVVRTLCADEQLVRVMSDGTLDSERVPVAVRCRRMMRLGMLAGSTSLGTSESRSLDFLFLYESLSDR